MHWDVPLGNAESKDKLAIDASLKVSKKAKKTDPEKKQAGKDFEVAVEGELKLERLAFKVAYDHKVEEKKVKVSLAFGNKGPQQPVLSGEWVRKPTRKTGNSQGGVQSQTQTVAQSLPVNTEDKGTAQAKLKDTITLKYEGDTSLGDLISGLSELILGEGKGVKLGGTWDALNKISMKNLELVIDLADRTASLTYDAKDWEFKIESLVIAKLSKLSINYGSRGGKDGLYFSVDGKFLGEEYSADKGNAIGWDILRDNPPAVPGTGKVLDLRYLAVGQHVKLKQLPPPGQSLTKVVAKLREEMQPPAKDTVKKAKAPAEFDAKSGLLIGADFTVLDTLSLTALYQDPSFAGVAITLSGKRAKAFEGLSFELVYRRIGDVGVYSTSFKVPDKYRKLAFGPVGLTIGTTDIDIYTNSDFKVDLGFPANADFARSFVIETPTMTGKGGFYFSKLSGSVAGTALTATNGRFDPVISAGLGLSISSVKQVKWGPVSGKVALSLTVILEGTYAPWMIGPPGKEIVTDDYYFKFTGIAAIAGTVNASVDFIVISARVCVEASARVMMVMEAYEPTTINAKFHIAAKAAVKIGFWTVDKSFEMDAEVDASFGTRQIPPWRGLARGAQFGGTPPAELKKLEAKAEPTSKLLLNLYPVLAPSRRTGPVRMVMEGPYSSQQYLIPKHDINETDIPVVNLLLSLSLDQDGFRSSSEKCSTARLVYSRAVWRPICAREC